MLKALPFTLLLASLSLTSVTAASAAPISTDVHGHGPFSGLVVDGDDNDVEFFAGPCPGGRPSRTVIAGSGRRGVRVAPCHID